jgi:hypothetical protein
MFRRNIASAIADSNPVFGRKSVLPTGSLSDCRPNTRASRRVRRRDLLAKGRLPNMLPT